VRHRRHFSSIRLFSVGFGLAFLNYVEYMIV
jgi:hypothetical protein